MAKSPAYGDLGWTSEEQITSTKLDGMCDNAEFLKKYKLGTPQDADANIIMAYGKKSITGGGGVGLPTTRVTFATDSLGGDPEFSAAPVILITLEQTGSGTLHLMEDYIIEDVLATSFDIWITMDTATSETYNLHWIAIGVGTGEQ